MMLWAAIVSEIPVLRQVLRLLVGYVQAFCWCSIIVVLVWGYALMRCAMGLVGCDHLVIVLRIGPKELGVIARWFLIFACDGRLCVFCVVGEFVAGVGQSMCWRGVAAHLCIGGEGYFGVARSSCNVPCF